MYDDDSTADADAAVQAATFRRATPAGGVHAGTYTKDAAATSLPACLASCCDAPSKCDTLFFHADTCFLIHCNSTALCEPQAREDEKFEDTVMMIVREPRERKKGEILNLISEVTNIYSPASVT